MRKSTYKKPKSIKTDAGLKFINDWGFRRSPSYITNGHFVVPFKFETEIEDEIVDKIIPKPEERPIKIYNTGIYLKSGRTWHVIFADKENNAVIFNKQLIDPFNVETLMAVSAKKSCAVFENGSLKYLVMPVRFETLENFQQLLKIYKPLGETNG